MIESNAIIDGTRTLWRAGRLFAGAVVCIGLALAVGCRTTGHEPAKAPVRKALAWTPSPPVASMYGKTNSVVTNTPSATRSSHAAKGADTGFNEQRSSTSSAASVGPLKPAPSDGSVATNMLTKSGADVRLRPGLLLDVTVLVSGKKEIEEHGKRVSDSGFVTLPMLGSVTAKDKTLAELTRDIETLYRKYFVNPQVIVDFVRDDSPDAVSPWGFATVLGRVKKPGRVSLPATRDMTVSGAIQQAGGFDTSAKDSAIRVTRRRDDTGAIETREINLRAVGAVGKLEDDIVVQADDVIFVPELVF